MTRHTMPYHTVIAQPPGSCLVTIIATQIKEVETGYHRFLDESYGSVAETSFKALRRKMPLTQQKFQWTKISTYSLAKELTNK